MHFDPENIYHIYNRGNQKQQLFFSEANYLYFLAKIRKNIFPACEILSWCLMPNHFHFLIYATTKSCEPVPNRSIPIQHLSEQFRIVLSGYTKAIQKQQQITGNLFQQKTQAKPVNNGQLSALRAFHYIHQNPKKASLVTKMEEWQFSSFRDYIGLRNGSLCNKELAKKLLGFDDATFYEESYGVIPDEDVEFL